jgi:hypothetical protein
MESKCLLTSGTLPGSPTVNIVVATSSGRKLRWYIAPLLLMISSDSAMYGIV